MNATAQPVPMADLMVLIRRWREDEFKPVHCPVCSSPCLEIADRSARPHREWYALTCPACQFEQTVAVPLGAPVPGAD
jgi:hypothetical protein